MGRSPTSDKGIIADAPCVCNGTAAEAELLDALAEEIRTLAANITR